MPYRDTSATASALAPAASVPRVPPRSPARESTLLSDSSDEPPRRPQSHTGHDASGRGTRSRQPPRTHTRAHSDGAAADSEQYPLHGAPCLPQLSLPPLDALGLCDRARPASPPLEPQESVPCGPSGAGGSGSGTTTRTTTAAAAATGASSPSSIHRTTRPPALPLAGALYSSPLPASHAPITPHTLSPPPPLVPSPLNATLPPPTPTSARTFGPPTPTAHSPVAELRETDLYPRRGSTGTFGAARSRSSAIILPTTLQCLASERREARNTDIAVDPKDPDPKSVPLGVSHTSSSTVGPDTLGRTPPGTHAEPESPAAIMQHLLDARERSELAILPSEPEEKEKEDAPLNRRWTFARPEAGLTEGDVAGVLEPTRYWNNRHTGIFDLDEDQVDLVTNLRERSVSEAERVLEDLCDADRPAKLSTEIAPETSPEPLGNSHRMQSLYRVASVDSVSSGYAESATAGLLPRKKDVAAPPRLPAMMANKADLPADQKAVLIKRTRKLEKVLGAPLPERTVERFVVEPTMVSTTIATKVDDSPWPRSEAHPEWMREDCVPQRAVRHRFSDSPGSTTSLTTPPRPPIPPSARSRLARAFLGDPAPAPASSGLQVYVSRECMVAETRSPEVREWTRRAHREAPIHRRGRSSGGESPPASPRPPRDSRRVRRNQLAKLQRLLGNPITPALLNSPSTSDEHLPLPEPPRRHAHLTRTLSNASSVATERTRDRWTHRFRRRGDSPGRLSVSPAPSGGSFVGSFGTTSGSTLSATASASDETHPPTRSSDALTADQRRVARRRATKLGKLFGDAPPASLYLPGLEVDGDSAEGQGEGGGSPVYESYRHSLNSLIFMAEHDQERLALLVDELEDTQSTHLKSMPPPPSPLPTPTLTSPGSASSLRSSRRASAPPESVRCTAPPEHPLLAGTIQHPAPGPTPILALPSSPPPPPRRRRRTSKLAHFFGERHAAFGDPSGDIEVTLPSRARVSGSGSDWSVSVSASRTPLSPRSPPVPLSPPLREPIVHNGDASPVSASASALPPPPRRRMPPISPDSSSPRSPRSAAHTASNSDDESAEPILGARRPSARGAGRRSTLDAVLGEMWDDVQTEVAAGGVGSDEAAELGDMMGVLRRSSEAWCEMRVEY